MQAGGGTQRGGARVINLSGISLQELSRLLNSAHVPLEEEEEVADEDDDEDEYNSSFQHASHHKWFQPVTEPQEAGVELINSGEFGRVANRERVRRHDVNIAKVLKNRNRRPVPSLFKEDHAHVSAQ
jgi:WD repeat-containing protein 23